MRREIYEVGAKIVDSNGTFNQLSGYPKLFDSHTYNDDIDKAEARAYAEWHSCLGQMYLRDDRQLQYACITRISDGAVLEWRVIGRLADYPDPEPEEPEEE